MPNKGPT